MAKLREWMIRLWQTVRPGRNDRDLERELRLHLELASEDARRGAVAPEQAARTSRIQAGPLASAMEALRDQHSVPWLRDLGQDVRYALRTLRGEPSFATVAVLTLGLGIGSATGIYSIVNTILLQPLPFTDSHRLVRVVENIERIPGDVVQLGLHYDVLPEWRRHTRTLEEVIWFTRGTWLVTTSADTIQLFVGTTSVNTFTALGVRARLGRTLVPADEANPHVVVLSHDTWRQRFQSDPNVVGMPLELHESVTESRLLTIVGVLPPEFELPAGPADIYVPVVGDRARGQGMLLGRLTAGASRIDAEDEANRIGAAIRPPRGDRALLSVPRFEVQNLRDLLVSEVRPALRVLAAAVTLLLLIVCANVANLLLARGTARRREMALRFALGASRGRVVRQVLTECFVLSLAGGLLGAVITVGAVSLVTELASVEAPGAFRWAFAHSLLPRANEIAIDLNTFAIALTLVLVTSIACGLLPALHLSRMNQRAAMGSIRSGFSRSESRMRRALVVGQLALATVLLVGAALLIQSFVRLTTVEKGYDPSNVLTFQLVYPFGYETFRKTETIEALLVRFRADPRVESAGFTRAGVLIPEQVIADFVPEGKRLEEVRRDSFRPQFRTVSHGYFAAMGVPLLDGRDFTPSDTSVAAPVLVISRTVAQRYFGTARAVGRVITWHASDDEPPVQMRVVGVVEDVRLEFLDRDPVPEIFVDYRQFLEHAGFDVPAVRDMAGLGLLSFAVRVRGLPTAVAPAIREMVRSVDANAGIDAIVPVERMVASSVARPRFYTVLLGVFAAVAGFLATIGVFGLLAYAVTLRTQEFGVRMALGAQPAQVMALVLRTGAALAVVGIALGLAGAVVGTRVLQGLLFGVAPLHAATFLAVGGVFCFAAMLACYLPARRATHVDPFTALRWE